MIGKSIKMQRSKMKIKANMNLKKKNCVYCVTLTKLIIFFSSFLLPTLTHSFIVSACFNDLHYVEEENMYDFILTFGRYVNEYDFKEYIRFNLCCKEKKSVG